MTSLLDYPCKPNQKGKPMSWKPPISEVRRYLTEDEGWTEVDVDRFISHQSDTDLDTDGWTLAAMAWRERNPGTPEPEGVRYPDVEVQLTGADGNAFMIIGRVQKALRRANVSDEERERYTSEAMSGDYDNLLATTMRWVSVT